MARYTAIFTISVNIENLQPIFTDILTDCGCEILYHQGSYLMARECPGKVSFSQLVTVDITFDKVTNTSENIRLNIVIRNEELPLKLDNHCSQIFDLLIQLILENYHWEVVESIILGSRE